MRNVSNKVDFVSQNKSKFYYIFWSIMALAVVGGQLYVGNGYREMANAIKYTDITVNCKK